MMAHGMGMRQRSGHRRNVPTRSTSQVASATAHRSLNDMRQLYAQPALPVKEDG